MNQLKSKPTNGTKPNWIKFRISDKELSRLELAGIKLFELSPQLKNTPNDIVRWGMEDIVDRILTETATIDVDIPRKEITFPLIKLKGGKQ